MGTRDVTGVDETDAPPKQGDGRERRLLRQAALVERQGTGRRLGYLQVHNEEIRRRGARKRARLAELSTERSGAVNEDAPTSDSEGWEDWADAVAVARSDYKQVGSHGGWLDVYRVHRLLYDRHEARLERDHDRADARLLELQAMHVRVSDEARAWWVSAPRPDEQSAVEAAETAAAEAAAMAERRKAEREENEREWLRTEKRQFGQDYHDEMFWHWCQARRAQTGATTKAYGEEGAVDSATEWEM